MNNNYKSWDGAPPMNSSEQASRNGVFGCGGFDNPFSATYRNPLNDPYSFESLKLRSRATFAIKHDPQLKRKIEHFAKNADQFKIRPIHAANIGRYRGPGQIMASALLLGAGTAEIPPIAVVIVVGGTIVAGGIIVWNKITGYGDASKWVTTHQPVSESPLNRAPRGFDPNNWPNDVGRAIKMLLAGVGIWQIYDIYDSLVNKPLPAKKDSTNTNTKLIPHAKK